MSNRLGLGFCLFEKTNCPCVCLHDFSRSVFSIFTIRSGLCIARDMVVLSASSLMIDFMSFTISLI